LLSLGGTVVAVFISKKIAFPLALLTQYSRELPKYNFKLKGNSSLESIRPYVFNDEIRQLVDAFAFMELELRKNILDLESHHKNLEELVKMKENERKSIAADLQTVCF